MPTNRRKFLWQLGQLTGSTALGSLAWHKTAASLECALRNKALKTPEEIAVDEVFWQEIRQAYTVSPTLINLNNGGVSPQPRVVQEAVEFYNRLSNETPTYYMWRVLDRYREALRRNLAQFAGCSSQEIAINRNASEALETIIFGLRLQRGDEVIISRQAYPTVMHAWKQRALRDGIVIRWLNFELPIEDEAQIIDAYQQAFTDKTKIVHLTHIINWTGQIMPVKKIAQKAHEKGIEILVDGAHSFAHLDYRIPDLECDYYGTSLHKWLCAPFGTGMLYVKKEKIGNLFPLLASEDPESKDIRKFENLGTRAFATEYAIGHALQFHEMIGTRRKQARLQYLKNYWMERIKDFPGVKLHTSLDPHFACGIGLFSIEGRKKEKIKMQLEKEHGIHVVSINWENIQGVRVTPNVYTLTRELDTFIEAIRTITH